MSQTVSGALPAQSAGAGDVTHTLGTVDETHGSSNYVNSVTLTPPESYGGLNGEVDPSTEESTDSVTFTLQLVRDDVVINTLATLVLDGTGDGLVDEEATEMVVNTGREEGTPYDPDTPEVPGDFPYDGVSVRSEVRPGDELQMVMTQAGDSGVEVAADLVCAVELA